MNMNDYRNLDRFFKGLRKEYSVSELHEQDMKDNPFEQFALWFETAAQDKSSRVNSMTLCTSARSGQSCGRVVLLKGFSEEGFVFYTNWESRKAKEIEENPKVALVFYWPELERQVVIEGKAHKLTAREADDYFNSRPRFAQIAAWTSAQSVPIESRQALERKFEQTEKKFENQPLVRPLFWGGYCVSGDGFEFWQGRRDRLNDRVQYVYIKNSWQKKRLQP